MKKIIIKPKAITLVFLFFGILAVLIPTVVVLGFTGKNPYQQSWQIDSGTQIVVDLKSASLASVNACVTNNNSAGKSFLVPYKTLTEWNAFVTKVNTDSSIGLSFSSCCDGTCNNGETVTSCPADCAILCDYRPENSFGPVYSSAIYSSNRRCGATAYCNFTYSQTPSPAPTQIWDHWMGGNCNAFEKYYHGTCASLIRPSFSICQGDPCIIGIDHTNEQDPVFYLGTYEHSIKTCMHASSNKQPKPVSGWGLSVYIDNYPSYHDGSYSFNTNPYFNGGTYGTWGSLYTQLRCGDGVCTPYTGADNWETCSSCPSDCGTCTTVACSSNSQCSDNYCNGLVAHCDGGTGCSYIPDEESCGYTGFCDWVVDSFGTCPPL